MFQTLINKTNTYFIRFYTLTYLEFPFFNVNFINIKKLVQKLVRIMDHPLLVLYNLILLNFAG